MKKRFNNSEACLIIKASVVAILLLITTLALGKYLLIISPIVMVFVVVRNLVALSVNTIQFKKDAYLLSLPNPAEEKYFLIKGLY